MNLCEAQKAGIAPWDDVVDDRFHLTIYRDRYPCTPGHLLFVPANDHPNMICRALEDAYLWGVKMVESGECDGFNVGLNSGTAAGQTVMYPHVHLIPRRKGDVEDPVGGIRNTIPGKGNYKK